jgi:hypothetical protein
VEILDGVSAIIACSLGGKGRRGRVLGVFIWDHIKANTISIQQLKLGELKTANQTSSFLIYSSMADDFNDDSNN